jgi:flagellar protein FlbD
LSIPLRYTRPPWPLALRRLEMIKLNRLDGEAFILNADLIKYVEHRPDTFITLTSGDRIVVTQSPEEVMQRTIDYQRSKRLLPEEGTSRQGS